MALKRGILAAGLLFLQAQAGEDAPGFSVLRIMEKKDAGDPDELAKVTFKVVPDAEAKEERKKILQESKHAHGKWEAAAAEYEQKHPGKRYFVPEPALAEVTIVRKGLTEEKAKAYAKEQQEEADLKLKEAREKRKKKKKKDEDPPTPPPALPEGRGTNGVPGKDEYGGGGRAPVRGTPAAPTLPEPPAPGGP